MSIWYKKTLGIVGLGLTTTMISSSVVSCGASFDAILNRTVDPNVYKSIYTHNVSSWNTAHSMQAEDSRIWSNTFDTFLSTDQYGRIYGSLAQSTYGSVKSGNLKYPTVGYSEYNATKWTYKMREMNWVDYNGNKVNGDNSVIFGVRKAAKYALNPKNGSDVSSLWTSFIKGANEIYKAIGESQKDYEKDKDLDKLNAAIKEQEDKIDSNDSNLFGITGSKDSDGGELITFTLAKASPYFESLLTYSVFSPINPTVMNAVNDYIQARYNGAYYVQQANPNGKIILKKNPHYALKESTKIETLEFNYLEDASASRERTLFESGSTSLFELKSDDLKGWNRYIGKGKEAYDNPNFGAAYEVESSPEKAASFMLVYNYYNANIDNAGVGVVEQQRALNASKLLQSKNARAFISTNLNRTELARFFSKTIDEVGQNSQMLRNTYTGEGVAQDENGIDYTQYIAEEFDKHVGNTPYLKNSDSLKDGQDPYRTYADKLAGSTQAELISKIKDFIKVNNIGKQKVNGYGDKVILKVILSPVNNNSLNPYMNLMMKSFNKIKDNPIYIETKTTSSNDEYKTEGSKGTTDLFLSGWSPDYKDPSSFLETITLTGPYRGYNGTVRLFESKDKNNKDLNESGYIIKNKELKTKNSIYEADGTATDELLKAFETYSNEFKETDMNVTDPSQRYTQFAKQEHSFYYENFLALNLYTKALPKVWTVSYLAPYTKSYEAFGTAQFKLYNTYLNLKLLSEEEWKKVFEDYKKKKELVKSDWTLERNNEAHWKE